MRTERVVVEVPGDVFAARAFLAALDREVPE